MFETPSPLGGNDRERLKPLLTAVLLLPLCAALIKGMTRAVQGVPGQMDAWIEALVPAGVLLIMWFPRRLR